MELACKGQYRNALILHLMYSLSLDPYHIYSLIFDGTLVSLPAPDLVPLEQREREQ